MVSFDGSSSAGFIEVARNRDMPRALRDAKPEWRFDLDPDGLQTLQVGLKVLLQAAFTNEGQSTEFVDVDGAGRVIRTKGVRRKQALMLPMPTLRFGCRNTDRPDVKRSMLKTRERRQYEAPGAFVMVVSGGIHDLMMFLVLHLLTAEGMAGMLARCPAPRPREWEKTCENWLLRTGHGRKSEYCSDACKTRAHAKRKKEEQSTSVTDQLRGKQ